MTMNSETTAATTGPRVKVDELEFEMCWMLYEGVQFTGIAYDLWPDGRLRSEVPYVEGYATGIQREWYPSGQLKSEGIFNNGVADGFYREWTEDGRLALESVYHEGALVSRVRHEGEQGS